MIADVRAGEMWVFETMVSARMAWHYLEYSKDPRLASAEQQARKGKLGLWRDPKPIPPWEFRKELKAAR